jgi:hypothetical protein
MLPIDRRRRREAIEISTGLRGVEFEVSDFPSLDSSLSQCDELITVMKMTNPDVAIDTANLLVGTKAFGSKLRVVCLTMLGCLSFHFTSIAMLSRIQSSTLSLLEYSLVLFVRFWFSI